MLNTSKFAQQGLKHFVPKVTGLASLIALVLAGLPAQASVSLTRADVEALRNRVELIPRGRQARTARISDVLAIGDALRTAAASQADLRFNDGSLARVGERATFRFVPNTRNFRLTNGTVLLLIPPGQGRTNVQTPSAVTGIQGSAVVVRYIPDSDLTVVMALTNNPAGPMTITTSGCGGSDTCGATEYSLYGGQMALIQDNQVQVVEFDLPMFYQTSPLVEGLELDNPNAESPLGPALEGVRQETLEALEEQTPFTDAITLNPDLIGMGSNANIASEQPWGLSPASSGGAPISILRGVLTPGDGLITTIPSVPTVGSQPAQPPTSIGGSGGSVPTPMPPSQGGSPGGIPGPSPISSGNSGAGSGAGAGSGGVDVGAGAGAGAGSGGVDVGAGAGAGAGSGGVDVGAGVGVGSGGVDVGVGVGVGSGNNGVGVGVGGDPGNNNGVGPGGNNGNGNGATDPFVPPNK
ncbi:FecR family protein [Nodosilinea nodulosa]|uniref:FecR family protein n=1 Tax=Nodosilinea nodulosa TaxID=416001 RepID=UPI00030F8C48|nr:FecR family protein [Nodosilinea nodulosa]